MINSYNILKNTKTLRVSDEKRVSLFTDYSSHNNLLVIVLSQLGDFDTLEYAWWLKRFEKELKEKNIEIRAIGIGDINSGLKFCEYTGFPQENLFVDSTAKIHQELDLYKGLSLKIPLLSQQQNAWVNLMLMCGGIGSKGTLKEVFRGYKGDKNAPQLIKDEDIINLFSFLSIKGSFFEKAGGKGFQRPFELATLRLKNMIEVLNNWKIYVPNSAYMTQRGGTFLFNNQGNLIYEYRDLGILGFSENMSNPLSFII